MDKSAIRGLLESLTGQQATLDEAPDELRILEDGEASRLGHSQLNELLLLFGLDRVSYAFFCYLVGDGCDVYNPGFESEEQLRSGIDRFRVMAMLDFGNFKSAFKILSTDDEQLDTYAGRLEPLPDDYYSTRPDPVMPITPIPPDKAYLTGYLVERELKQRLEANPHDTGAQELESKRREVVEIAMRNHTAYLASDHLDVYVATSMRERAEFSAVSLLTQAIFEHPETDELRLRWFDPTQAVCPSRVDKGLAEALMLRRAACTIYLVQESDTLGKDSELASTLAQGKPVIAFIPRVTDEYLDAHLANLAASEPGRSEAELLLSQLKVFDPCAAWVDPEVRGWCDDASGVNPALVRARLKDKMSEHYDRRASTIKDSHPLGIQVSIFTGVANGVLVVRSVDDCAKLVRKVLTGRLQFEIDEYPAYVSLRETVSDCAFRVVTRDEMLTNSFWNHYINPVE